MRRVQRVDARAAGGRIRPTHVTLHAEVLRRIGVVDREAQLFGIRRPMGVVAHDAGDAEGRRGGDRLIALLVIGGHAPRLEYEPPLVAADAGGVRGRGDVARYYLGVRRAVPRLRPFLGKRGVRAGMALATRAGAVGGLHGDAGERRGGRIGGLGVRKARSVAALTLYVLVGGVGHGVVADVTGHRRATAAH